MRKRSRSATHYLRSLYSWHRWIGVLASLFVLLLASTGLALNHAESLHLNQRYVCTAWLLRPYGLLADSPNLGMPFAQAWWTRAGGWLWRDAQALTPAPNGSLLSRTAEGVLLLEPSGDWTLFAPSGEVLERGSHTPAMLQPANSPVELAPLPGHLAVALSRATRCRQITWERWLLDLHAGRLLGLQGARVMDAAAIAMIVLAISGLLLWRRQRRRQQR